MFSHEKIKIFLYQKDVMVRPVHYTVGAVNTGSYIMHVVSLFFSETWIIP